MPNFKIFQDNPDKVRIAIYGNDSGSLRVINTDASGNLRSVGTVVVSAGTVTAAISTIQALEAGTMTVSGGTIDVISALTAGTVNATVTGGTIDVISALTAGTVNATVTGGTIDVISALTAGTVNATVTGGTIDVISALTAGTVNATVTGGTIDATLTNRAFTEASATLVSDTGTINYAAQQNTSARQEYTFFFLNAGTANMTAKIQVSPTALDNDWVDDISSFTVTGGSNTAIVTSVYAKYTRVAYQATSSGTQATLVVYYNARV